MLSTSQGIHKTLITLNLQTYTMAILCSPMELSVSLPTVESDVNLVVTFPEDPTVQNVDYSKKTKISCQLEFSSTKPISKSDYIIVTDKRSDIRCST